MTWDWYKGEAIKTLNKNIVEPREKFNNGMLGLVGEVGELADHFKKHFYQGHVLDREYIIKELGDICWYIALCENALGLHLHNPQVDPTEGFSEEDSVSLVLELSRFTTKLWNFRSEQDSAKHILIHLLTVVTAIASIYDGHLEYVLDRNIEKLRARYKNQEFSSEQSQNRGE